jgi:sigma-B regulation protein RsbU (phosphoserine phosphatase)
MNEGSHNHETDVANRLKRLIEANQYLADIESLDSLFPKLLELSKSVTSAEASSLMLYNPDRDVLEFASVADEVIGKDGKEMLKKTIALKIGEGIAGWVAENRKPLIIEDAQNDPRFFNKADRQTGFVSRTLLSVLLVYGDELLGVINVLRNIPELKGLSLGVSSGCNGQVKTDTFFQAAFKSSSRSNSIGLL